MSLSFSLAHLCVATPLFLFCPVTSFVAAVPKRENANPIPLSHGNSGLVQGSPRRMQEQIGALSALHCSTNFPERGPRKFSERGPNFCRPRARSRRIRPSWAESGLTWAKLGPKSVEPGRSQAKCAPTNIGPASAKTSCRFRPVLARARPNSAGVGPRSTQHRPNSRPRDRLKIGPASTDVCPKWANTCQAKLGPKSAKFVPTSAAFDQTWF